MTPARNMDDALTGDSRVAAMVDAGARIDSVPVLFRLLAGDGEKVLTDAVAEDVGLPDTAFRVCNLWSIDALAQVGRVAKARGRFEDVLSHGGAFRILSEDLDAATGELWGHVPQTRSMAGIIDSAMRPSQSWEDAW